ncbi:ribonuclease H-like protein [Scleroderma citrinum]
MPKSPKVSYYAVRKGRDPGIYRTWDECEAQIKAFPGAAFKKFTTETEATAFIAGKTPVSAASGVNAQSIPSSSRGQISSIPAVSRITQSIGIPKTEGKDFDVVYCDGACKGNGQFGSVAGIGVWWGHNDPRNISERCPGDQTNNRAELVAIVRILETTPPLKRKLLIKTDSNYSIQCVTSWIFTWRQNGYLTSNGKPVKNRELIKYLVALLHTRQATSQIVEFEHVRGHIGIEGNEAADRLANMGALEPPVPERDWERMEQDVLKKASTKKKQACEGELKAYADGLLNEDALTALDDTSISNINPRLPTVKRDDPARMITQAVTNSSTKSRLDPPKTITRAELEAYASCLMSDHELEQLSAVGEFSSDY